MRMYGSLRTIYANISIGYRSKFRISEILRLYSHFYNDFR